MLAGKNEAVVMAPVGSVKPLVEACRLVAAAQQLKVSPPGESKVERTLNEQVLAIAAASRFRTRQVALRDDWWRRDQGPLLAIVADTNSPVALLPVGPRRYELAEPATGTRATADAGIRRVAPAVRLLLLPPAAAGKAGRDRAGEIWCAADWRPISSCSR